MHRHTWRQDRATVPQSEQKSLPVKMHTFSGNTAEKAQQPQSWLLGEAQILDVMSVRLVTVSVHTTEIKAKKTPADSQLLDTTQAA